MTKSLYSLEVLDWLNRESIPAVALQGYRKEVARAIHTLDKLLQCIGDLPKEKKDAMPSWIYTMAEEAKNILLEKQS